MTPALLITLLMFALTLAVVNAEAARKPDKISAARYESRCGDAYRAVRWYRARYNEHRQTLGFSLAPPVEQAMNCRRLRERAAYWRTAAKVNRQAVERRYRLPVSNDWRTSVLIVQRVYPGTASWLLSCSAAEGGHGRWVRYGGGSYYPGYEHTDAVGGQMQFRPSTYYGAARRSYDYLTAKGFRIPRDEVTGLEGWLSPMGQALAAAYLRAVDGSSRWHWAASISNGCA